MFLKAALKLVLLFVLQICPTLVNGCGTPPDMENAICSATASSIGSWAYCDCKNGYTLHGRNRILCTKNGWTKPYFYCQKIQCDQPPSISNGMVTEGEEWTYGAEATYSCDEGYNLSGQETIHCTDTGDWSHPSPNCTEKSCGSPGEILNGWYNATGNTFGAKVTFYCEEGYQISGLNYRLCKAHGWSGDVPSCQPVTCDDLPSIENGFTPNAPNGEYWESGSVAKFSCIGDYSLIGAKSLICLPSGRWSNDPPTCRANRCGTPPDVENAICSVSGYTIGSWAYYTCNNGYIPYESNRILCTKHGWTKPSFYCQKIQCDQPPSISNGRVTEGEEWTYGAEASYSCNEGYTLTGQETIHCTDTRAWSHPPPVCTVQEPEEDSTWKWIVGSGAVAAVGAVLAAIMFL